MSTKDPYISEKQHPNYGSNPSSSNSDSLFTNLNLNQSHNCQEVTSVESKSISNQSSKVDNRTVNQIRHTCVNQIISMRTAALTKISEFTNSNHQNNYNSKSSPLHKSDNSQLLSPFLTEQDLQEAKKEKSNFTTTNNSSTLSLHIAAYENSSEIGDSNKQDNSDEDVTKVSKNAGRKLKDVKQIFNGSIIGQTIEFPRQQKETETTEPEIMQFKSSQKLLQPNQQQLPKKNESKNVDGNSDKMDAGASPEMEQNQRIINHCRILQVLTKCTEHFQRIFKQRWLEYQRLKNGALIEWKDSDENRKQLIELCASATSQMKESFKNDSIDLWDITLHNYGIQAISNEIRRLGGITSKQEDIAINCIRETRNKLCHGSMNLRDLQLMQNKSEVFLEPELSDDDFQKYFNQLSHLMIKNLGETQSAINEVKDALMKIGESKFEPVADNTKIEFKKLKEEAKKLFEAKNYDKAIEIYNKILELSGLSRDDQAIIYSNLSAAYFSLKTKDSYLTAKRHADFAIQLRPIWWRGYFRLGKAEHALGNLREAENGLRNALTLNSGSQDIRNELSAVSVKLDELSREDYLNPDFVSDSYEKSMEKILKQLNLTEKEYIERIDDMDAINGDKWRMGHNNGQQDFTKAIGYYSKSAANGNVSSILNLAKMYRKGEGAERNYKEVIRLLRKAANSKARDTYIGSIREAQHFLGMLYQDGEGIKKDYFEALKWYEMALANGYAASANNLGMMYLNGQGVEQSSQVAYRYFKSAAESGDTAAMQNLAEFYFRGNGTPSGIPTVKDNAEGINWLKLAAKKGNQRAQKRLETVENLKFDELVDETLENYDDITIKSNPMDQELFGGCIKIAAKRGSKSAQRLMEIWKQLNIATNAFKKNDSKELVAALSKAIRIDHQIAGFPDIFHPMIIERHKTHPDDLDAVTCYIRIMMKDESALNVLNEKLEIFPLDEFLLDMKISVLLHSNKLKDALAVSNKAIELHPKNLRLIYGHACVLYFQKPPMEDCIKFFDDFLAVAPPDHNRIPASYYLKARYYFETQNISKFKSLYETAVAAEKKQLPCFLPYDFPEREHLKVLYNCTEDPSKLKKLVSSPPAQFLLQESLEKVKTNLRRKHLLIQQRQYFIHVHQQPKEFVYDKFINCMPEISKVPNFDSLKKIMIKDIILAGKEKLHEGFVLKARVIDWSLPMLTAAVLIQDAQGDVERLTVCAPKSMNMYYKREIEAVMTRFRPNVIVSIVNPYMHEAASDKQNVIRVENAACIIVDDTDADKRCSCCGKQTTVKLCSGCNMSRYCSKECQVYDWNDCNHKSVCKSLQKYAIGKK